MAGGDCSLGQEEEGSFHLSFVLFLFFFKGYGGVGGERVWEAQNPNACLYICNMLVNSFLLSISARLPRASNLHIFFNFIHTMRGLKTIQISDASCIYFIYQLDNS